MARAHRRGAKPFSTLRRWSARLVLVACGAAVSARGERGGSVNVALPDWDCVRVPPGDAALDWRQFRATVLAVLEERAAPLGDVVERRLGGGDSIHVAPAVRRFVDAAERLVEGSLARIDAQRQCPIELLCMCVLEGLSLSFKFSSELDSRLKCIREVMDEVPVFALAGSQWPVFRLLDLWWNLNKQPDHPNIDRFLQRHYEDFAFTPEELAPFGQGVSVPWTSWLVDGSTVVFGGNERLDDLGQASAAFQSMLLVLTLAAQQSIERDGRLGPERAGRPLVKVSLVFGEAWAELVVATWARWAAAGVRASIFIAMDEAARAMCRQWFLHCVETDVPSVLHKYTVTALAMHLGVDVLYCDMDAVPMGPDPVGALLREAGDADLAVSTHNYDCLNAGVWYARASGVTGHFFLTLLEYLYKHWYEIDQRAMEALASGNISVSHLDAYRRRLDGQAPRLAVLSPDVFAGSRGFARKESVVLFHACAVYGAEKMALVRTLLGIGEMPLEVAGSRALLSKWWEGDSARASVREAALEAIARWEKPRSAEKRCW